MSVNFKLVAFLKSRHHLISLMGAFVVFLTFVVNETILDRYEELTAQIGRAGELFVIREDLSALRTRVDDVTDQIVGTVKSSRETSINPNSSEKTGNPLDADAQVDLKDLANVESATLALDNTGDLITKLPFDSQITDKYWELRHYLIWVSNNLDLQEQLQYEKGLGHSDNIEQLNEGIAFNNRRINGFHSAYRSPPQTEIDSLGYDVLQRAKQEEEIDERWTTIWKRCSYAFYTLGWGLGLIGKLYGGGDLAGDE